ncbi:MAG: thioether cross-link-forming SCIFF peptide maturase [Clostridiales Family XIII bacterium]|jgi:uncharacterized protein|nr:thioether cross-link-forming SCIFF peptide maturase [Clostridiales Family XIII bacterium]
MIHRYKFDNLNIVLDVNSGAVHVAGDAAYRALAFFETAENTAAGAAAALAGLASDFPETELREAILEIEVLTDEGTLFGADEPIADERIDERGAVIKAMCLHVAHDCNMSCRYCFADDGSFAGRRSLLSAETGRRAVDFLLARSGSRRNLEIDFFGGEPLLNFPVVRELVAYGRERETAYGKRIRFTITTNGLLLDAEKGAFCNAQMDNVILSIDGRPAVNDAMRKTAGGGPTYDLILKNYRRFVEQREGKYYVRGTFTRCNPDFSEDVRHLADLGFRNISAEPVVADPEYDFALREEDVPRILEEYDRLAALCLDRARSGADISFFHFNMDLEGGPCVFKRIAGCGAGTEYVAVSPEGDLYPCHRFVGKPAFRMGNIDDENFENAFYARFNRAHIQNKPACKACWAKFYCGGGCHANAYQANGDILKPYAIGCALERKRVECAIGIRAALLEA